MLPALMVLLLMADPKPGLMHSAPAQARPFEALQVDGALAAGSGTFREVVLLYRGPGQEYVESKMELQYGDLYRGFVPASRMTPPGVEYYIEGRNKGGDRVPLFMTARKPARVIVLTAEAVAEQPPPEESAAPPSPEKKKGKRGKKAPREEEPPPAREEAAEPEPEPPPAKTERFPKAEKFEKTEAEPVRDEPEPAPKPAAKEPKEPKEPKEQPRPAPVVATEPRPAPQERRTSARSRELDEELAVYNAEYPAGFVVKLDEAVRKSPYLWTTITAAQMQAMGARHVYEVLDTVPGVSVSRDVQGFYRAAVRGIRGDSGILYLLDGHPLGSFWDGKSLAYLPIDNLERIEVLRGPGPSTLPAGNFTAVVNLVPDRKGGVRAALQTGLNATNSPAAPNGQGIDQRGSIAGHVSAAHAFDFGLTVGLDADLLKDNGYYKPIAVDGLKLATPAGFTLDRRVLTNVGLLVQYQSKAVGKVWLKGRVLDEWRTPLVGQFDVTADPGALRWRAYLFDLGFQKAFTDDVTFNLLAWVGLQNTDRLFHQTPRGFPNSTYDAMGIVEQTTVGERNLGLQASADFKLPFHNVVSAGVRGEFSQLGDYAYLSNAATGGSTLQQPLDVRYPLENGSGVASRRVSAGLFLTDEWRPIERFTLQAGLRFELVQLPFGNSLDQEITGSQIAVGLSPRLGLAFAPIDNLVLKANYGRGFRAPTVEELSLDLASTTNNQGRVIGNANLQPETIDSIEGSVEYLYGLGDAKARFRGAGFYEKLGSPIAAVDTTGNLYAAQNRQDGVQSFGVELEVRVEVTPRAHGWANFSWVRAQDLRTVQTAWLITDVPQLRFNAGLSVPIGPYLTADGFLSVHGERRNNARSVLELLRRYQLPAYSLVGLQLRTEPLFDHLVLSFTVHNLFDVSYADDAPRMDRVTGGVPREGLSGMLAAKVLF